MKEIVTWQASVKVNGRYYMLPEQPTTDLHAVTTLVEKAAAKLNYHYFNVTYVRYVTVAQELLLRRKPLLLSGLSNKTLDRHCNIAQLKFTYADIE